MNIPLKSARPEKLRRAPLGWKRWARLALPSMLAAVGCSPTPPEHATPAALTHEAQTSGTDARLIAVSPVNEQVVWVSGARGTWLRTTDGGATWHGGQVPGADSLQFRDVQGVDANTAYLLSIGPGEQSRIYKTTDAGATWTLQLRNELPAGFFDCFSFWDAERGIGIGDAIGTDLFVIITEDGGAHWERIPYGNLPEALAGEGSFAASGTCVVTRPGGLAWMVSNNKEHARILRTADFGRHWTVDALPVTTRDGVGAQSVAFRDDLHGIVLSGGYASQPTDTGSAFTEDGGNSWTVRARPPRARGVWGGVYVPGARTPVVVAVGPAGSVYSRDDGRSWIAIDTLNYWSVGFASPRAGWAVGEGGRIVRLGGF